MARPVAPAVPSAAPASAPRERGILWWLIVAALVLSVAGVGIATYNAFENLQGSAGVCTVVHGCETVQKSRYGKILGIPISVPGVALYVVLTASALGWLFDFRAQRRLFTAIAFNGALFGFLFSCYLTYLEAFVINAWCIYCIGSASILTALFIIWTVALKAMSSERSTA
jgi:uncharacterized membrane protein